MGVSSRLQYSLSGALNRTFIGRNAVLSASTGREGGKQGVTRLGLFPPQGSYFLLYMQRIALYSQVGLNPVYIKEIEHLFCAFFFFLCQSEGPRQINKQRPCSVFTLWLGI